MNARHHSALIHNYTNAPTQGIIMRTYRLFIRVCFIAGMLLTTQSLYAVDNLSSDEIRSLFSGNTVDGGRVEGARQGVMSFYSAPFISYFGDDGKVYSVSGKKKKKKSGAWRVDGKGHLCIIWKGKKEKCAPVYKEGEHYKQNIIGTKGKIKWTNTYSTFTAGDTASLQDM